MFRFVFLALVFTLSSFPAPGFTQKADEEASEIHFWSRDCYRMSEEQRLAVIAQPRTENPSIRERVDRRRAERAGLLERNCALELSLILAGIEGGVGLWGSVRELRRSYGWSGLLMTDEEWLRQRKAYGPDSPQVKESHARRPSRVAGITSGEASYIKDVGKFYKPPTHHTVQIQNTLGILQPMEVTEKKQKNPVLLIEVENTRVQQIRGQIAGKELPDYVVKAIRNITKEDAKKYAEQRTSLKELFQTAQPGSEAHHFARGLADATNLPEEIQKEKAARLNGEARIAYENGLNFVDPAKRGIFHIFIKNSREKIAFPTKDVAESDFNAHLMNALIDKDGSKRMMTGRVSIKGSQANKLFYLMFLHGLDHLVVAVMNMNATKQDPHGSFVPNNWDDRNWAEWVATYLTVPGMIDGVDNIIFDRKDVKNREERINAPADPSENDPSR